MRGNPPDTPITIPEGGSIPAYAGEPRRGGRRHPAAKVYPRVCGGTWRMRCSATSSTGLSPRMRGNPSGARNSYCPAGSIPAYAGEPLHQAGRTTSNRVYPRVCGGTPDSPIPEPRLRGLSPRMRGNPVATGAIVGVKGSIPAYAGEPLRQCAGRHPGRVYPRVCGGTTKIAVHGGGQPGLSPRMRGNLCTAAWCSDRMRSIPAYAGEPRQAIATLRQPGVYPRVCGGTSFAYRQPPSGAGLSPRMRGNQLHLLPQHLQLWSIPAYAGEPRSRLRSVRRRPVYPRVCGGTPRRLAFPVR